MDSEYNDLTTDNTATSFDNSPDNLATSDELSASSVYTDKMGTAYSIGKGLSRAVTVVGLTISLGATGFSFVNTFATNVPEVTERHFVQSQKDDSLDYGFTITNKDNYPITFHVQVEGETFFSLDVSKEQSYKGSVTDLGYDKEVTYSIYYVKDEIRANLFSVTYTTIHESEESTNGKRKETEPSLPMVEEEDQRTESLLCLLDDLLCHRYRHIGPGHGR